MELTSLRISAVSFLNTSPLVWGLLHGPQQGDADLWFEVPSACAASVAAGTADIGIIPVIEMYRQNLPYVSGLGIASNGPVRSIFLVSHVAADKIRSVALDTSSRTSAVLARIILAQKYSNLPRTFPYAPLVNKMLNVADAALVIGDPALRLAPEQNGYYVYDLGREWTEMTGLPMVYAVWAGRRAAEAEALLHASYQYGRDHIEDIVQKEAIPRGVPVELARKYLTQHIVYELSEQHERGLDLYLKLAASV